MFRSGQPHGHRHPSHSKLSCTPTTRYLHRWHASNGVIVIGCPCRKERHQEMDNRQGRLRAEEGIKLRYFKESYAPENALTIAREGVCMCVSMRLSLVSMTALYIESKVEMKYSCHPKYITYTF